MDPANEKELINSCKNGDRPAFDRLVREFEKIVFNFAYRLGGRVDEAEDIVQEVFLQVNREIYRFRQEAKLSTWLYRITINIWRARQQKKKIVFSFSELFPGRSEQEEEIALNYQRNETEIDCQEDLETKEKYALLYRVLDRLNRKQRVILVLRDLEQKSYEEMAEVLKISSGTVKSRLSRAREVFKKKYEVYQESVKEK